jgi:hypothetical protein
MKRSLSLTLLPILFMSLFVTGITGSVQAQTPFALTGIGQPVDYQDARMIGRGGWGMAEYDSLNPGFLNVASLSALRHVAIKFTAYGENANNSDSAGSRTTHRTLIPGIQVGLPVIPGRLAFTGGIEVGRSFEYRTLTPMTWNVWADSLVGNDQFTREGSLWQVPLGLSWRVFDGLSLAGTVGLVNGSIRETVNNFFIQPVSITGSPLYLSNGRVEEDEFSGHRTTWSVRLGSEKSVALGASYTPAHNLDVKNKVAMGGVGARAESEWVMDLPVSYRAGIKARLSDRWSVGSDATLEKFSDFNGNPDWSPGMVDEYSVSFGLERKISFERHGGRGNLPLRLGARYRRWAYLVGDEEVEERTFNVGTGFPFHNRMGMLDIALSYSMIGDLEKNGLNSNIWRMTVSVTGLEKWW